MVEERVPSDDELAVSPIAVPATRERAAWLLMPRVIRLDEVEVPNSRQEITGITSGPSDGIDF
jgi:hypothetical protein